MLKVKGQYDVIVINGSLAHIPTKLQNNLASAGRIFAIIGNPPSMEAVIVKQTTSDNKWQVENLFETNYPRLKDYQDHKSFIF